MSQIRVGTAAVDVTPEPGLPLMGNFRDDYAARGTHDPLWGRAIVFADSQGTKAGLLAVDVCMVDRGNVALIREAIGEGCDVPPENVLVHATHTHSGPATSGKLGMAEEIAPHAAAIELLLRKAASAVIQADRRLEDATVEAGCVMEDRVSFHRRLRRTDGTTQMNWEALQPGFDPKQIDGPWGPIDPELTCLTLRREGTPAAVLVSFGLHPAILAGDNWQYSADYPGYLRSTLSRSLGGETECLFVNGCCGDVNHVDYHDPDQGRGFEMAERVGTFLASAACRAIDEGERVDSGCLRVVREYVELDRLQISPREQQRCREVLENAEENPPEGQVDGLPDAYFARLRQDMARVQEQPDPVEVMAIRLGETAIVGLPGEVFCELGLEIKRRSPARYTIVAGLCNDAVGYLPTMEAFLQRGYETTAGSTFYAPGSGGRLVESAVRLLEQLYQK